MLIPHSMLLSSDHPSMSWKWFFPLSNQEVPPGQQVCVSMVKAYQKVAMRCYRDCLKSKKTSPLHALCSGDYVVAIYSYLLIKINFASTELCIPRTEPHEDSEGKDLRQARTTRVRHFDEVASSPSSWMT